MSPTGVLALVREMLAMVLVLVSPILLTAILSSLLIGIVQAGIRITDLTLSFVPRFIAVLLVVYFGAGWACGQMIGYIDRAAVAMRMFSG